MNVIVNAGGERRKEDKPAMSLFQPIDLDGGVEGEVSHNVR